MLAWVVLPSQSLLLSLLLAPNPAIAVLLFLSHTAAGDSEDRVNLALGRSCSQSSTYATPEAQTLGLPILAASNAVDGYIEPLNEYTVRARAGVAPL